MDKYIIGSTCTALSDRAISFTVACKNLKGDVIAYGNVTVYANMNCSTSVNFYSIKISAEDIYNEMIQHCKEKSAIIFK